MTTAPHRREPRVATFRTKSWIQTSSSGTNERLAPLAGLHQAQSIIAIDRDHRKTGASQLIEKPWDAHIGTCTPAKFPRGVVENRDAKRREMGREQGPIAFHAFVGMVAVNEKQIDRTLPAAGGLLRRGAHDLDIIRDAATA